MSTGSRDTGRARFYDAERLAHNLMNRAGGGAHTVQIAGTTLTVPAEARFGDVAAVSAYVADVLALPGVRDRFPRADIPVTVRRRRGVRAAHYEYGSAVIAVPDAERWALRELVVLHELAHHLDDRTDPAAHGRSFVDTLIDLVGLVLGPEAGLIYRIVLSGAGAR